MKHRHYQTGLLVLVTLLAAACDIRPADAPVAERVIYRGNGGEPGSLDPALADDIHAFNILIDLYEGLVTEAADGALKPGVAESWLVDDDGLSYRFELRADARWSDGSPVVAADFVRAFRRLATPATASTYATLLDAIEGFDEALAGEAPADGIGVTATSEDSLTIRLERPAPHLASLLALPIAYPAHPAGIGTGITNGAFVLDARQLGGAISLMRNPHYRAADSVRLDRVVYLPVADAATELNMYRAGELDITHSVPADFNAATAGAMQAELRVAPMLALYYLAFDLTEPPLDDPALRQALSLAIDREQLVTLLGRGERAAYSIVPPGVAGYAGGDYAWRDLDSSEREQEARDHYRRAGFGADRPLSVRLLYDVGDVHERVAISVVSMWREVLGMDVELEKREWAYFLDSREQRDQWDVMRFAWFGDYNSPMTFLEIFHSASPQNLARYANREYDEALRRAGQSAGPEAAAVLRDAEAALIRDYPIAPLYFFVSKHLVKPRVGGFADSAMDRHPSRFLYLVDENER